MVPKEIRKRPGGRAIALTWPDGHASEFPAPYLRRHCRCAACQHELTGEQLLDPATVSDDLTVRQATLVGQYALGFQFSDDHATGIYSFEWLRRICPCCQTTAVG